MVLYLQRKEANTHYRLPCYAKQCSKMYRKELVLCRNIWNCYSLLKLFIIYGYCLAYSTPQHDLHIMYFGPLWNVLLCGPQFPENMHLPQKKFAIRGEGLWDSVRRWPGCFSGSALHWKTDGSRRDPGTGGSFYTAERRPTLEPGAVPGTVGAISAGALLPSVGCWPEGRHPG